MFLSHLDARSILLINDYHLLSEKLFLSFDLAKTLYMKFKYVFSFSINLSALCMIGLIFNRIKYNLANAKLDFETKADNSTLSN